MLDLQNPPVAAPESALVPGMSAPEPAIGVSALAGPMTGGFPNITDSSGPGIEPTQVPGAWVYDFDPGTGSARATFSGIVQFTSGGSATAGVTSFNTRTGAVTLTSADITAAGGAPLASPTFTGIPAVPTAAPGTSTTQAASTAFVGQAIAATPLVASFNGRTGAVSLTAGDITGAGGAPSASPALTGTPTAPTAVVGDNSSTIATTAYVNNWAAQNTVLSFNGRRGAVTLSLSDITSVGGAPVNSPNFTGTPLGPTAAPGTATTQLASTAFVTNAVAAATAGVSTWNGRSGAVTMQLADVTGVGGAPLVSPSLTGTPLAPTATAGTNTTQIATTAFVATAITNMAPVVTSFQGRTGAVTLQLADVTAVGGAPLASPTFTGTPATTTPPPGDNSTRVADTAFVAAAVAASVVSFNGRTGAVTLSTADVSAAGGPYLPTAGGTVSGNLGVLGSTGINYSTFTAGGADGASHSYRLGWTGSNLVVDVDGVAAVPLFNVSGGTFTGPVTAPTPLTVSGLAQGVLKLNSGSREWDWISNQSDSACYLNDFTGSASRLQINTNGTCINTTGSWTAFSDPRVKTDIAPYDSGLQAVLSLQPITYRYNGLHGTAEDPEGTLRYGLDAAETQKVMPELVGTSSLPDHDELLTVDTGPLIFALVNAVRELSERLVTLEAKAL